MCGAQWCPIAKAFQISINDLIDRVPFFPDCHIEFICSELPAFILSLWQLNEGCMSANTIFLKIGG